MLPRFRALRFSPAPVALLLTLALLAAAPSVLAQLRVDIALRRALFIRYEPLVATVTITNLSGREIELRDDGNHKWFSFQIETASGALVPPYNPDYSLTPAVIGAGEKISRAVNVTPLYPMSEYGVYRIRATVFDAASGKYFSSAPLNAEVTEGRVLWQQTVGVPANSGLTGTTRQLTLLNHRLPDQTQLYLRIEDRENGLVYGTMQLGKTIAFAKPQVEIDASNQIYVLQNTAPRMYLLSKVGLDGKVLDRRQYSGTQQSAPRLVRNDRGEFDIVGGTFLDPNAPQPTGPAAKPPGVSERPVALPTPQR